MWRLVAMVVVVVVLVVVEVVVGGSRCSVVVVLNVNLTFLCCWFEWIMDLSTRLV